jgi:hypothetical protein
MIFTKAEAAGILKGSDQGLQIIHPFDPGVTFGQFEEIPEAGAP